MQAGDEKPTDRVDIIRDAPLEMDAKRNI